MMKNLFADLGRSLRATLILAVVCCGIYPLVVWSIAQLFFSHQANGSLTIAKDGTVRGSDLLGQNFTAAKYFHSRPSAAGLGYDGANSGGSNLGPTSKKLNDTLKDRVVAYRAENGLKESEPIPADAVTASGSGLDPHISRHNAEVQIARVANARHCSVDQLRDLVAHFTDGPSLGFLGEPGVNVLRLNLALDHQ